MQQGEPQRARSLAEFQDLQVRIGANSDRSGAIGGHRPRPTDVVISPFGKSGTTWTQQIFHCLRTRGDDDFDDISRVVPWIETSRFLGLDLEAPQRAEPRGFKSHLPYDQVPKPGRYIVPLRDPKDAFLSTYRFMEGWFFEPGAVSMEEFSTLWSDDRRGGGGYWSHLLSWWSQRERGDVLLLSYEHMSADPEQTIRRIAELAEITLDDELLALTLERSSLSYMLEHKHQFDDRLMRDAFERDGLLPPGGESSKVRTGEIGGHRLELPSAVAEAIDARWAERIVPELGFEDYAALIATLP